MMNLFCKLGWHRPLMHHQYYFTDRVSNRPVYICLCPCGKKWMCDSKKPFGGFKIKLAQSNGVSYNEEPED